MGAGLVNYIQGLADLLVFGAVEEQETRLKEISQRYNAAQLRLARISGLNAGMTSLFSNLSMWLVVVTAIPLVRMGELSGVLLATLALVTLASFEAVQPLPQAVESLSSSLEAGARLFEVVDAEPAVVDPDIPADFPVRMELQAKDLTFRYPGAHKPALREISFQLQQGNILAVVGPSGGGKTTLANLLLRFWDEYQGELTLGPKSIPLRSLEGDAIRQSISVVSQNGYLFHDSVRANIALGKPDAQDPEIIAAARKARIHASIQSLPEGYQTLVGERGQRLSAGERQRILIARGLLKDAPIFLLDEPTANLDPVTEKALLETLFEILEGKTVLLMTHRLVSLSRADQILVLHQGRIIEQGTESELLEGEGFYHLMWSLQNRILHYR
jgi:ATP-binding cassette subfamily C protein CydC